MELLHAGLSYSDDSDVLQLRLAEAVPSAENGRGIDWLRPRYTWVIPHLISS